MLTPCKNPHNQMYPSMTTKKKHVAAKCYFHRRMMFSHSLMVPVSALKFDNSSLILLDPGVKMRMNSVILACCLSYIRSLATSETVPQCIGHASFLTLIFHKVV